MSKSWKNLIVCDLEPKRYAGKWYEIARYPHRFEKNLEDVTAEYLLLPGDKIKVINAGTRNGKRKEAQGKAYIPDVSCKGHLKVSFFWPFRSDYNIILLDKEFYQYAVVVSKGTDYLWFLSREPQVTEERYTMFIDFVEKLGFDPLKIIKVKHNTK